MPSYDDCPPFAVCHVWGGCEVCDRVRYALPTHRPATGQEIESARDVVRRSLAAPLSRQASFPVTDIEVTWFRDAPSLRPEVSARPPPSLVDHVGMAAVILMGTIAAMSVVGLTLYGVVCLLGGWSP